MSRTESAIYEQARILFNLTRQPIPTCVLADFSAYSERWTRRVLVSLEARGIITRRGQRGGWLPVGAR